MDFFFFSYESPELFWCGFLLASGLLAIWSWLEQKKWVELLFVGYKGCLTRNAPVSVLGTNLITYQAMLGNFFVLTMAKLSSI